VVKLFTEFSCMRLQQADRKDISQDFYHSSLHHISWQPFYEIPQKSCNKVKKGINRTPVRDMMTMKKRQSVALY